MASQQSCSLSWDCERVTGTTQVAESLTAGLDIGFKSLVAGMIGGKLTSVLSAPVAITEPVEEPTTDTKNYCVSSENEDIEELCEDISQYSWLTKKPPFRWLFCISVICRKNTHTGNCCVLVKINNNFEPRRKFKNPIRLICI